MADRSVRVVLSVVSSAFSAGMAKAAADTKTLTGAVEKHGEQVGKLSTTSLVAGAALAAGVGLAVKAYADFDQQMSRVASTGEDAKASMGALREAALQAGADTKFSATEAGEGVENLLKAGVSAKDVLGGGLAGALSLASAGEMDVADAAEVAATALTQFKLQGSDVGHVADLLAAGAGNAQGEVSDMAAALKQGGLVAGQFGLSIEGTVGGLSAFASAGLIGSDAGTSLKSMLLALANPSSQSAELMATLGINAYDTGGKFIGLEGLAGVLQDRLKGLTDAQRQQALGQIFGSDAMRAASVLYDQGAAGMAEWTDKVAQSGYAQQVAAEKMNNLKGDIEQLGGSVETTMIKVGAAADGPLRTVVQGVTALVNAAGDAPPALQTAFLVVGGGAAAALLLAGGLGKAVVAVNETRVAMQALGITAKTASLSMGAIGIALTVAGIAYGAWADGQAKAQAKADDFSSAIKGQTDAVNENTRAVAAKQLQDAGALAAASSFGIALSTVTDAALGNAAAQAEVRATIDAARASQEAGIRTQIASGLSISEAAVKRQALADAEGRLTGAIGATNAGFNTAVASAKQLEAATAATTTASGGATAATSALAAAQKAAETQQQALTQSVRDGANALLQQSGSAIGLESAIDKATETAKENGRTLDINTEKGRQNRSALDTIASSSLALQKAQEGAGATTEALNASTQRAREAFIATAQKMGATKAEAEKLADSYGLVPKTVTTAVSVTGTAAAAAKVSSLQRAVDLLHDKTITISAKVIGSQGINVRASLADGFATGGHATGYVTGPGTATSDSIPAWLSNGEFVVKASSVDKIGLDRLWYMNRYGQLPGFADGGHVHYSQATPRYAGGGAVSGSLDGLSAEAIAAAVASGLASSTLHLEMDGRPIDARIRAVTADSARGARR